MGQRFWLFDLIPSFRLELALMPRIRSESRIIPSRGCTPSRRSHPSRGSHPSRSSQAKGAFRAEDSIRVEDLILVDHSEPRKHSKVKVQSDHPEPRVHSSQRYIPSLRSNLTEGLIWSRLQSELRIKSESKINSEPREHSDRGSNPTKGPIRPRV